MQDQNTCGKVEYTNSLMIYLVLKKVNEYLESPVSNSEEEERVIEEIITRYEDPINAEIAGSTIILVCIYIYR